MPEDLGREARTELGLDWNRAWDRESFWAWALVGDMGRGQAQAWAWGWGNDPYWVRLPQGVGDA